MRSRQQELEAALTRAQQEAAALASQLSEAKRESADVAALLAGAEGRAQAAEQVGRGAKAVQPAIPSRLPAWDAPLRAVELLPPWHQPVHPPHSCTLSCRASPPAHAPLAPPPRRRPACCARSSAACRRR